MRAGLIAAGAVVGGVAVASLHHDSTTPTAAAAFAGPQGRSGQLPGARTQLPGGTTQVPGGTFQGAPGSPPNGFGGGAGGEQRLSGTLVSVSASAVTVRTSSGTATYLVTASSQIIRNGHVVRLSALQVGDAVFAHVYPSGSSSQLTVERLFAASSGDT